MTFIAHKECDDDTVLCDVTWCFGIHDGLANVWQTNDVTKITRVKSKARYM